VQALRRALKHVLQAHASITLTHACFPNSSPKSFDSLARDSRRRSATTLIPCSSIRVMPFFPPNPVVLPSNHPVSKLANSHVKFACQIRKSNPIEFCH
jgi:hypothetical protein